MCQLGAEKNVGFGSDFDGIETTPVDCKSPADVPKILDELRRRGYSEEARGRYRGPEFPELLPQTGLDGVNGTV